MTHVASRPGVSKPDRQTPMTDGRGFHVAINAAMQKGDLASATSDVHGKISKKSVELDGVSVTEVTFGVGARWSTDLKPDAGTETCELPHVALVQDTGLHVVMDDGSEDEFRPGNVMLLPPGHDAWSVGDEPCVFVEFSRGNDIYA